MQLNNKTRETSVKVKKIEKLYGCKIINKDAQNFKVHWSHGSVDTAPKRDILQYVKSKPVCPWKKDVKLLTNRINRRKTRILLKTDMDDTRIPKNKLVSREDSRNWD